MSKTTDAFIEHENVVSRLVDLAEAAEEYGDRDMALDFWRAVELIEDLQDQVARLEKDNDGAHELADYYRNRLLKRGAA